MDVKTIIISIIASLLALVICGLLYLRMIKKEVLKPIGKFQAILPVILGGICVPISGGSGIGLLYAFKSIGVDIYAEATKELKKAELINFEEYFKKLKDEQMAK